MVRIIQAMYSCLSRREVSPQKDSDWAWESEPKKLAETFNLLFIVDYTTQLRISMSAIFKTDPISISPIVRLTHGMPVLKSFEVLNLPQIQGVLSNGLLYQF